MTASTKPKTPSMKLNVRPGVAQKDVDAFCKRASRLSLSQLVDQVVVKERLAASRKKQLVVDISFYPKEEYLEEYDVTALEILAAFATKFSLILRKEIQAELKKLSSDIQSQRTELGKGKAVREARNDGAQEGDDEGEPAARRDEEGSEVGDGDAEDDKRARQSKQQATYASDDDSDEGPVGEFDDAAIEAAYGEESDDEDVEMADGEAKMLAKDDNLAAQIQETKDVFLLNLKKRATAFSFSESGVKFELEVSPRPSILVRWIQCFFHSLVQIPQSCF